MKLNLQTIFLIALSLKFKQNKKKKQNKKLIKKWKMKATLLMLLNPMDITFHTSKKSTKQMKAPKKKSPIKGFFFISSIKGI